MRAFVLITAVFAGQASGQEVRSSKDIITTRPESGINAVVSAGDPIWMLEKTSATSSEVRSIQLANKVKIGNFMKGSITIPQDSQMVEKAIGSGTAACTKLNMLFGRNRPCLFDMDKDGMFEAVSFSDESALENLTTPVRYVRVAAERSVRTGRTFRSVITYMGSNGPSLSLSYREFIDDLARPAFTEELSVPLGKNFPQDLRVKGITFRVNKIDGMGINYLVIESRMPS